MQEPRTVEWTTGRFHAFLCAMNRVLYGIRGSTDVNIVLHMEIMGLSEIIQSLH